MCHTLCLMTCKSALKGEMGYEILGYLIMKWFE